jgi:hypothetical protein
MEMPVYGSPDRDSLRRDNERARVIEHVQPLEQRKALLQRTDVGGLRANCAVNVPKAYW